MFSIESPHRGDSNENTQYTIFNINTKLILNYLKSAAMRFFQGTQERVRNSRGKRVISVRATEVLLYMRELTESRYIDRRSTADVQNARIIIMSPVFMELQSTLVISTSVISNNRSS